MTKYDSIHSACICANEISAYIGMRCVFMFHTPMLRGITGAQPAMERAALIFTSVQWELSVAV